VGTIKTKEQRKQQKPPTRRRIKENREADKINRKYGNSNNYKKLLINR